MVHDSQFQWSLHCSWWLVQSGCDYLHHRKGVWMVWAQLAAHCKLSDYSLQSHFSNLVVFSLYNCQGLYHHRFKAFHLRLLNFIRVLFIFSPFFSPFTIFPVWTYPPSVMSFANMMQDPFVVLYKLLMKILNSISSNMKTWGTLLVTSYQNLLATGVLKTESPT